MHEVAVVQDAIQTIMIVVEDIDVARITNVHLVLGNASHYTEEAVRHQFQSLTRDTPMEGATLTLSWLPVIYQCSSCRYCFQNSDTDVCCPRCGEAGLEVSQQDVCYVQSIDIVSPDD